MRRLMGALGYYRFEGDALAFLTLIYQDHRLPLPLWPSPKPNRIISRAEPC